MHQETMNGIVTLVALGAGSQWIAWRLRIPSILVLLTVGFVAGPVSGLFKPDEVLGALTFPFVSLAAAIVLFEGGLTASWEEIRGVAKPVRRLIVVGIPVTWVVLSAAGHYLLGLSLELALLLGAILVVTGPTVIGPLLRHARPRGSVGSVLKLEGIINDPVGAILAVLVFQGIRAEEVERAFSVVTVGILKAALISSAIGLAAAFAFVKVREKELLPAFLQNAVVVPFALVVFALANRVQAESGLLAVTVMGIALASQKRVDMEQSLEFTEHARILLISVLFILLTARMEIDDITGLPMATLGFVAVAILVARPLSVGLATVRSGLSKSERVFLAAMAPRGVVAAAVSSLFALELVETGYPEAAILMPVTFSVIALTVLASGLSAVPLVNRLGLSQRQPQGVLVLSADRVGRLMGQALQRRGVETLLVDSDKSKVEEARRVGLRAARGEMLSRRLLRELDSVHGLRGAIERTERSGRFHVVRNGLPEMREQRRRDLRRQHPGPAHTPGLIERIVDEERAFRNVVGGATRLVLDLPIAQPEILEGDVDAVPLCDLGKLVNIHLTDPDIEEARLLRRIADRLSVDLQRPQESIELLAFRFAHEDADPWSHGRLFFPLRRRDPRRRHESSQVGDIELGFDAVCLQRRLAHARRDDQQILGILLHESFEIREESTRPVHRELDLAAVALDPFVSHLEAVVFIGEGGGPISMHRGSHMIAEEIREVGSRLLELLHEEVECNDGLEGTPAHPLPAMQPLRREMSGDREDGRSPQSERGRVHEEAHRQAPIDRGRYVAL